MQPHWAAKTASTSMGKGAAPTTGARRVGAFAVGLALMGLAACTSRPRGSVAPLPPPAAERPAETKPGDAHRVAILVPLTGPNAPVGSSLANAATLALVDTGKAGVRLTSYDTAALGASEAARRALADGAQLILGPLLAADSARVRALAEPRGIATLSFSNDSSLAGGRLFVLGFQPAQSVDRVVGYAASRGLRRFAALVPDGVYGQRASVAFTRAVRSGSGQVVALTNFVRTPAALPAAARKVTASNVPARQGAPSASAARPPIAFEALLVADSGTIAAGFAPHLAKSGAPLGSYLLMGTELWNTERGLGRAPALNGAVFAAVPDQRFQAMARRYQARFAAMPSRLASLSYDAMLLAASAAGTQWRLGQAFPADALADRQGFAGVDGIFRFRNNIAERGLEVQQVTPAGFTTVSPAPAAF